MSKPVSNETIYYFNVLDQSYTTQVKKPDVEPILMEVKFTADVKVGADKVDETVKNFGNYIALVWIAHASKTTAENYCDDYEKHPGCVQKKWNYCLRCLDRSELAECKKLERIFCERAKELGKELGMGIEAKGPFAKRGESALWREMLHAVKGVIDPSAAQKNPKK